jgi:hypothetical protein
MFGAAWLLYGWRAVRSALKLSLGITTYIRKHETHTHRKLCVCVSVRLAFRVPISRKCHACKTALFVLICGPRCPGVPLHLYTYTHTDTYALKACTFDFIVLLVLFSAVYAFRLFLPESQAG